MKALVAFALFNLQLLLATAETTAPSPAGCKTQCGNITIPYPFGIGPPGCFHPGLNLTCIEHSASASAPKLFLGDGAIQVTDIFLEKGQILINSNIAYMYCPEEEEDRRPVRDSKTISWTVTRQPGLYSSGPYQGPYSFSGTRNTFVTMGCSSITYVSSIFSVNSTVDVTSSVSVCASVCLEDGDSTFEPYGLYGSACSGIGCCQNYIDDGTQTLEVRIVSIINETRPLLGSSCTRAFLVDQEQFSFDDQQPQEDDLNDPDYNVPVVLDWAIMDDAYPNCDEAVKNRTAYACRSNNSYCYDADYGEGYRCNCSHGFRGNPYLFQGCKDINECEEEVDPCMGGSAGMCSNTIGSYSCICPKGKHKNHSGDPRQVCRTNKFVYSLHIGIIVAVGAGSGVVFLVLLTTSFLFYKRLQRINIKKHKARCFCENHGLLLKKLLTTIVEDVGRTKVFTLEELEKATNNFDITRVLGRGGHGTVYKGILSDQRVVAIKKSEIVAQSEIKQFINEVVILSQINHRNVVKLYGCCLETEVPLLVYEFISGGTLSDHLHDVENHTVSSLSLEDRLRIAIEVAGALAYLHSSASISIFHRDIKSSNILLDHNLTAKISDFGASRSIPSGKTHMTTKVQGTFGYLDPEYYHTGQLTEKSDVYSFGVILVELLTGERPISQTLLKEGKNLAMHFISSIKENKLFDILDAKILKEESMADLEAISILAEVCLRLKGEDRPTMRRIEQKLHKLGKTNIHERNRIHSRAKKYDESGCISLANAFTGCSTNEAARMYSLENEFILSLDYPR